MGYTPNCLLLGISIQIKEKLALTKQLTVLNTLLDRLKKVYLDVDFTREEYLAEKQSIEMEQKTQDFKFSFLELFFSTAQT